MYQLREGGGESLYIWLFVENSMIWFEDHITSYKNITHRGRHDEKVHEWPGGTRVFLVAIIYFLLISDTVIYLFVLWLHSSLNLRKSHITVINLLFCYSIFMPLIAFCRTYVT